MRVGAQVAQANREGTGTVTEVEDGACVYRVHVPHARRRIRNAAAELTRWKLSWSFALPQLSTACTVSAGM